MRRAGAVLLVLILLGFAGISAAADLLHHHAGRPGGASCPICHLSHQPTLAAQAGDQLAVGHFLSQKILSKATPAPVCASLLPRSPRAPPLSLS